MEKLTIEQKAKRYDEVLNRAKGLYDKGAPDSLHLEEMFPELKESDDEKIRKIISDILLIDSDEIREILDANNVSMQDIDVWLEKQGEQKPLDYEDEEIRKLIIGLIEWSKSYAASGITNDDAKKMLAWLKKISEQNLAKKYDITGIGSKHAEGKLGEIIKEKIETENVDNANNVESTFKVDDWVMLKAGINFHDDRKFAKITEIDEYGSYWLDCGTWVKPNEIRLWTIEDVQDGDVLAVDPVNAFVAIYKERDLDSFKSHCFIGFDGYFHEGEYWHTIEGKHPATKEQCDLLSSKMKEAGYEWDSEHKQLITLDHFEDKNDMVEPKFKVGDWVACEDLNTALIVNIVDDKYEVEFIDGNKGFTHIDYIDRLFHLWTIQDAEDGDIIYVDNTVDKFTSIKIVSELENETLWEYCSVWSNWENLEYWEFDPIRGFTYLSSHDFHPATKKQRDLLFQKMKEAGYSWNADKKELIRIE